MANERRLIDADALLKNGLHYSTGRDIDGLLYVPMKDVTASIKAAPTIDRAGLPCKIGDLAWVLRNYKGVKQPQMGFVSEMYYSTDMELIVVVRHIARGIWGRNVFATEAEAQAAAGKRKEREQWRRCC